MINERHLDVGHAGEHAPSPSWAEFRLTAHCRDTRTPHAVLRPRRPRALRAPPRARAVRQDAGFDDFWARESIGPSGRSRRRRGDEEADPADFGDLTGDAPRRPARPRAIGPNAARSAPTRARGRVPARRLPTRRRRPRGVRRPGPRRPDPVGPPAPRCPTGSARARRRTPSGPPPRDPGGRDCARTAPGRRPVPPGPGTAGPAARAGARRRGPDRGLVPPAATPTPAATRARAGVRRAVAVARRRTGGLPHLA